MSLYITRHGETDYNVKNLVCGISDARLTEKGIEQAKKLAVSLQSVIIVISTFHRYKGQLTQQIWLMFDN